MPAQKNEMLPSCPACEANVPGQPVHQFTAREATQHFVLAEEFPDAHRQLVAHIAKLWGADSCSVLACQDCGLRFAWPFVAGDGAFYNLAYPYSDYPEERWEFDQTARALPAVLGAEGPVLEIGSGFGYFLRKIVPAQVPPARVVAVEYNDIARQRLQAQGFTAIGEDIRSAVFDHLAGQLAAVFIFQVLEHLDDLGGVLHRLNELLRPGASVFIAVPNPERIEFNERNGALFDMPPNHISRWTKPAFQALAARAGWTLTDYRTEPLAWGDLVKQDFVYSHMRRSQVSGSLANRARGRPRTRVRLALEAAVALLAVPGRLPTWVRAARATAPLGDAVWAQFRVGPPAEGT